MKVLLTGAAGFIGTQVRAELLARGHEVVALDSLRPDVHRDRLAEQSNLLIADVRDAAALDAALPGTDAVCHLAAKVGLGVDIGDLPDYVSNNELGTATLLAAMARAGVGRLTIASSMVVYGEGRGRCPEHGSVLPAARNPEALAAGRFEAPCPLCGHDLTAELVTEDTPLDPRNTYAVSKLAQEHHAAAWAHGIGGSVTTLRYHNVYGPGMPRDTPYAGVAAIFLSALRRGVAPQVFEDGGQRRDFVHVRDVAAATASAVESCEPGVRAFNVGSGRPRTVGELAAGLAEAAGGPAPVVTGRYRIGDVRHITADSTRIRFELGWRPEVDFSDGLAELGLTARSNVHTYPSSRAARSAQ